MGLLSEGSPLTWAETKALSKHVQDHGIEQFIRQFGRLRDRTGDVLKWGDEVGSAFDSLIDLFYAGAGFLVFFLHHTKANVPFRLTISDGMTNISSCLRNI